MPRIKLSAVVALFMIPAVFASAAERSTDYDALIAQRAKVHGVPEALVHRTVMRESRYNPGLIHHQCYGLMQIKYATARSMGYSGPPRGLLEPQVNLTYGIPYLANAYRLADGDEARATALYRGGYYYVAKRKKMLDQLRTATTPALIPESAPPQAPQPPGNPLAGLFSFLVEPAAAASNDPAQITQ